MKLFLEDRAHNTSAPCREESDGMLVWHGTPDAPAPLRPKAGKRIDIVVATWPVEPNQSVCVRWTRRGAAGERGSEAQTSAEWTHNQDGNSYWVARIGPFARGDVIEYSVEGTSTRGASFGPRRTFQVAPQLWLALLWHQHQPLYRDLTREEPKGAYVKPWVRLHAIRDYYSMAALASEQPGVHVTINLTPVLLEQIREYVRDGATDRALELSLTPVTSLSSSDREEVLRTFFDADWHNQIFVHPRYRELFAQRSAQATFSDQDVRDLQMWFNLAWFGQEFRNGEVPLVTGEVASVRRFVLKARDFTASDIEEMVSEQLKIMAGIVPLHRQLQDSGVLEVSTTPFCHPILPLLVDSDRATIDRPNTSLPRRFSHPEDAEAQVRLAVEQYGELFGRPLRGMWPAEGAVAEFVLPQFSSSAIGWIATDQGVLARSGKWGYRADLPEVLCRAYRPASELRGPSMFFRATAPSDEIGFRLQSASDPRAAVTDFLERLKREYGSREDSDDRIITIALDGENAWGSYSDDGRPFLRALYAALADDDQIQTVTFSEYLEYRARAGAQESQLHELFTGSWIDEQGSAPGVDLGTWIGEAEENRAWDLLGKVRDALALVSPDRFSMARYALHAAEGSDWFWWFGDDQDSGSDAEFDDLFRSHLRSALALAGAPPIHEIEAHIVPHASVWTFSDQRAAVLATDRLVIRTNCAGAIEWWQDSAAGMIELERVGGAIAGTARYECALGPFRQGSGDLVFRLICRHAGCCGGDPCCQGTTHHVHISARSRQASILERSGSGALPARNAGTS